MDNFYKRRFVLESNDVSLNCTPATILPTPRPLNVYTGFSSLYSLLSRVGGGVGALRQSHRQFCNAVQTIAAEPVPLKDIRCPLDVSRRRARTHPWRPFVLSQLGVGAHRDLAHGTIAAHVAGSTMAHILLVLVDENTYCRICTVVYGQLYAQRKLGSFLGRILPMRYMGTAWYTI